MNFRKPGSSDVQYFSRLVVTAVNHSLDARGNYEGQFTAIPGDTRNLPAPEYTLPQAQPQLATVKDNKDNQGRIRVQFPWQRDPDTTDFIRVATPDAGSSKAVAKNRGFVFIPEPGDQVMVNFEHGNPDKPFVQSGMFHGGNGEGGGAENHKKSITTRSGCTIIIDDTDGKGSVKIMDPSGNEFYIDGKGNITVTAPKNFTINAGENISMNAGMNIMATAGRDILNTAGMNIESGAGLNIACSAAAMIIQNAGLDYKLNASNIFEIALEKIEKEAKTYTKNAEKIELYASKQNVQIKSEKTVEIHSGEKTLNA